MTFGGLSGYRREWLRSDLVAGLTTAAVVIPKSMAYATVAGLPIEVGLYTAFVPMLVYAFLGTSRPLSVSTTTTIAILTGAQLAEVVPNGDHAQLLAATAMLTLMVGGVLIVAAALRLGFVANFISAPVLVGFKAGVAVVIIVDQLPKILGIHFAKGAFLNNAGGGGQWRCTSVVADAGRGRRDHRGARAHRALPAAVAGTSHRGGGRHRRSRIARVA